jgi:hypothetical protein
MRLRHRGKGIYDGLARLVEATLENENLCQRDNLVNCQAPVVDGAIVGNTRSAPLASLHGQARGYPRGVQHCREAATGPHEASRVSLHVGV